MALPAASSQVAGMLFLGAGGQAGDQVVRAGGLADDRAIPRVDDQDFS